MNKSINAAVEQAWRGTEDRLAPIVSRKLGAEATFRGWTRQDKQGAVTPIFTVPASHRSQAEALGLLIA